MSLKVLFIGGTGIISSACAPLAIENGIQVYLLNRGTSLRPAAKGARVLYGDVRNPQTMRDTLSGMNFDVVVQWIAFGPEQVKADIELFGGRTSQYIFISSASAYQTPPAHLPVTESTPLSNPYWGYSRDKAACEDVLNDAYRTSGFPVTIVRPSSTYDERLLPFHGRYTVIDRMRRGKKVIA